MPITLEQAGKLLSAKRIMDYRRMAKGVPVLVDFKKMVEESGGLVGGETLAFVVDKGVVRAKLNVSFATYLQNPAVAACVHRDAETIRAAQDAFMERTGRGWRNPGDRGFWKMAVPLLREPHLSPAITLPFRNVGMVNEEGYDTAVDVGIFKLNDRDELELVVIERPELLACEEEIGKNYALVGGMTVAKAARIPQVVLELLEEGISNSIGTSEFYLRGIDVAVAALRASLPVDSATDTPDQALARKFEDGSMRAQFIAKLNTFDNDSVDGQQAKAKYVLSMLNLVDKYRGC